MKCVGKLGEGARRLGGQEKEEPQLPEVPGKAHGAAAPHPSRRQARLSDDVTEVTSRRPERGWGREAAEQESSARGGGCQESARGSRASGDPAGELEWAAGAGRGGRRGGRAPERAAEPGRAPPPLGRTGPVFPRAGGGGG